MRYLPKAVGIVLLLLCGAAATEQSGQSLRIASANPDVITKSVSSGDLKPSPPLAPEIVDALAILATAEQALQKHAANQGLLLKVDNVYAKVASSGQDEYTIDGGLRLREVRPDRISILVGAQACTKAINDQWQCSSSPALPGILPTIKTGLIYDFKKRKARCGEYMCVVLEFKEPAYQNLSRNPEFEMLLPEDPKLARTVYRYELREEGLLPVSFGFQNFKRMRRTDSVLWRPDYSTPVAEIELPAH